ncbi:MAG: hypothetical protein ACTIJ6_06475 [Leucobacter sp.]
MNESMDGIAEGLGSVPERVYRVSPERRAEAMRARRGIAILSFALLALSLLPWMVFTPARIGRPSLAYAALVLTVLSILLLIRLWRIARKADKFVAPDGLMLQFTQEGITIAGTTCIPWHAISGVWALDSTPALRARAQSTVFGTPGRALLQAGMNTANVTIGVADTSIITDPAGHVRTFHAVRSGLVPGRIEFPFGSQFGTEELHDAFATLRVVLPTEVPVRLTTGAFDYAAAWAGTEDDVATIREREESGKKI